MRIVWASHSSAVGGAELCLVEAARGLVASGHDIRVILPSEGTLRARLERAGATVFVLPYSAWMHTGRLTRPIYYRAYRVPDHARRAADFARLLRTQRPDVVVTNTLTVAAPALAARRLGIPHVWYIHEFGWEDHGAIHDYGAWSSHYVMRRTTKEFIVNSAAVRDKFRQHLPSERLHLVHYAVELDGVERPPPAVRGPFRLVLVGQLAPTKGQEDAVRAVAILKERGCDVCLDLVGGEKPSHEVVVKKLIKDLGVDKQVMLTGFVNHPLAYVARCDVALMCSLSEAFGRVTIEAMKLGKPVVGSRSGATTELVRDGWNGLLYSPGDADDLASKLEDLYHDRDRVREFGENAGRWSIDTFTMQRYVDGLLDVFECAVRR